VRRRRQRSRRRIEEDLINEAQAQDELARERYDRVLKITKKRALSGGFKGFFVNKQRQDAREQYARRM